MANVFKGLSDLKQHDAEREAAANNRTNWLVVEPDESVEFIFMNELDEDSPNYSEDLGLPLWAVEHNGIDRSTFWKRIICTKDEDSDCWACDENRRRWDQNSSLPDNSPERYTGALKQKTNFYCNVLVKNDDGEFEVKVVSRNRSRDSWLDTMLEDFVDESNITGAWYRLTRNGAGKDTRYRLKRLKDHDVDLKEYADKQTDLSTLINEVPYEAQAAALGIKVAPAGNYVETTDDESDEDSWL